MIQALAVVVVGVLILSMFAYAWPIFAIAAMLAGGYKILDVCDRKRFTRRQAELARQQVLREHADRQVKWYLQDDPRWVYGDSPHAPSETLGQGRDQEL